MNRSGSAKGIDGGGGGTPLPDPRRLLIFSITALVMLAATVVGAILFAVQSIDRAAIADEMDRARAALMAVGSEPDLLERLRRDFILDGARFTSPAEIGPAETSITTSSGSLLAWTPRRLGSDMFYKLAPLRLAASAAFLVGIALMVRKLYRLSYELDRRRHEAQELALRDALTGLGNRLAFDRWMSSTADSGTAEVGLLYLDLDDFKAINDRYGHGAGDQLLKVVAQRLAAIAAPADLVARIGGDEFAFVRPGPISRDELSELAADIGTALTEPVPLGAFEVPLGSSIGAALGAPGDATLVASADAALYRAKALPGHTFVFADAA